MNDAKRYHELPEAILKCAEYQDQRDALRAQVERLRAALTRYASHDEDCAHWIPYSPPQGFKRRPCSCGLDGARAALAADRPADGT